MSSTDSSHANIISTINQNTIVNPVIMRVTFANYKQIIDAQLNQKNHSEVLNIICDLINDFKLIYSSTHKYTLLGPSLKEAAEVSHSPKILLVKMSQVFQLNQRIRQLHELTNRYNQLLYKYSYHDDESKGSFYPNVFDSFCIFTVSTLLVMLTDDLINPFLEEGGLLPFLMKNNFFENGWNMVLGLLNSRTWTSNVDRFMFKFNQETLQYILSNWSTQPIRSKQLLNIFFQAKSLSNDNQALQIDSVQDINNIDHDVLQILIRHNAISLSVLDEIFGNQQLINNIFQKILKLDIVCALVHSFKNHHTVVWFISQISKYSTTRFVPRQHRFFGNIVFYTSANVSITLDNKIKSQDFLSICDQMISNLSLLSQQSSSLVHEVDIFQNQHKYHLMKDLAS
jgi:hypothetical protein